MTTTETLRHEIDKIDVAIQACQDESGVVKPWMKHRLNTLVEQRENFYQSVTWLEAQSRSINTLEGV